MIHNLSNIIGYKLSATNGEVGEVKEVYFEDSTWMIRYLIVETAGLFSGRKVLISPQVVLNTDRNKKLLTVNLTTEQTVDSPDIDTEKPVHRQQEIALSKYYGWPNYWAGNLWGAGIGTTGMMMGNTLPLKEAIESESHLENQQADSNPHLRSSKIIKGYTIESRDEHVGEVEDFVIDDIKWKIEFLVVDTGKWLPGKKVLISPEWVSEVKWATSSVMVNLPSDSIRNSPNYDNDTLMSQAYINGLHQYYEKWVVNDKETNNK